MTDTERLKTVIAAYGADPRRWPEADRHLAAAMPAAADPVDRLLAGASMPAVPEGATRRLMAALPAGSGANVAAFRPRPARAPWWPAAAALAASLALGIYVGAADAFNDTLDGFAADDPADAAELIGFDETLEGDA